MIEKFISIDTETTGLRPFHGDKPFLVGFYDGKKFDFDPPDSIFQDPNIVKVFANAKFDIHMLHNVGIEVAGPIADVLVMNHLLTGNGNSSLKDLAHNILKDTTDEKLLQEWFQKNRSELIREFRPIWKEEFESRQISAVMTYEDYEADYLVKLKSDGSDSVKNARWKRFDKLPDKLLESYFRKDLKQTFNLYPILLKQIQEKNLVDLMNNEHQLIFALVEMERRGALIDCEKAISLHHDFSDEMRKIERSIASKYGKTFNFNSGKQLGEQFVKDKVTGLRRTPSGQIQTDEDAMESYDHPLCKQVLRYKKCAKLQKTYCEGLLEAADSDGVIHASFKSTGATTGRFSCKNPNLQNIPRPDESNPDTMLIRSLFITRPGFTNYYLDYKQIEYRLAAYYFDDQTLIDRINNGEDLHTIQAKNVFNTETPTKEQRSAAKTLNFAVLYGAGVNKITWQLKRPAKEAEDLIRKFYWMNPNIKQVRNEIYKALETKGFITNAFGRRYEIPVDQGYKGLNYLCQGTSADIIKHAMVQIHKLLKERDANMILTVHDELCIEADESKNPGVIIQEIKQIMESFPQFGVRIEVDVNQSTTSWDKKEEL